jgi:hypothetical protein
MVEVHIRKQMLLAKIEWDSSENLDLDGWRKGSVFEGNL